MSSIGGRLSSAILALTLLLTAIRVRIAIATPGAERLASTHQPVTRILMRNVDFRIDRNIVFHINYLRGQLSSNVASEPPNFDDKRSMVIDVDAAVIAITTDNLADILNNYVFAYPEAPITNIRISSDKGHITQTAILHKSVPVPVQIEGEPLPTKQGAIRLRTVSVRAAGVPVKGLADLLAIKLQDVLNLSGRGVRVEGDDLILEPNQIPLAPRFRGHVTQLRVEHNRVIEVFGNGAVDSRDRDHVPVSAPNFMYFRGGVLQFGKVSMRDADLEIVDLDPRDPFYFYLDRYNQQLVAGYSRTTKSYGLVTYMPDFNKAATTPQIGPCNK